MIAPPGPPLPQSRFRTRIHQFYGLLAAAASALVLVTASLGLGEVQKYWAAAMVVAALMTASQLLPVMVHGVGRRELRTTIDVAVIVAAVMILPPAWTIAAAGFGALLGLGLRRPTPVAAANAAAAVILPATAAAVATHAIDGAILTLDPRLVVAAIVGGLIYEAGNLLLLLAGVAMAAGTGALRAQRAGAGAALHLAPLVAMGLLGGVLNARLPHALPLLAGPLAFIFLSAWSQGRAARDYATLDGLLDLATNVSGLSLTAVRGVLTSGAATLLDGPGARIGPPPHDGEIGVPLNMTSATGLWLCVAPRHRTQRPYEESDLLALKRVAAIGARALDAASQSEWISRAAEHDELTGLFNRRAFEAILEQALWEDGARTVLLFVDLDGFKAVNDQHGHDAGDEVLVETGRRLSTAVRRDDAIARMGGDEFTIILRGAGETNAAVELADRILAVFGPPFALGNGGYVRLSPSIGIAKAAPGMNSADLLRKADAAMYAAKRAGKNCWRELEVA